jgi:hypothetical protein
MPSCTEDLVGKPARFVRCAAATVCRGTATSFARRRADKSCNYVPWRRMQCNTPLFQRRRLMQCLYLIGLYRRHDGT